MIKELVGLGLLLSCSSSCINTTATNAVFSKDNLNSHLSNYSKKETASVNRDLSNVARLTFSNKTSVSHPIYLATAGGPGALKSSILECLLKEEYENFVYVDPDQRGLRLMMNTYLTQSLSLHAINKAPSFYDAKVNAYNYWRDASNYVAKVIFNKSFANKYNIAHGTTSTSPFVKTIYNKLKQKKYKIVLLLCFAKEKTRFEAIQYRVKVQANYQSTPEDAINKGKDFFKMLPVYFSHADQLRLYWTDHFELGGREVARVSNGHVEIIDEEGYKKCMTEYENEKMTANATNLPEWNALILLSQHSTQ